MLVLDPSSERPFQFGLLKAKAILDKISEIKKFASGNTDEDLLDISPPINNYNKFLINRDQAALILDCLQDIISFADQTEKSDRAKFIKEQIKQDNMRVGGRR